MTVDNSDLLRYLKLILETLKEVPEVEDLTDEEAARLARRMGVHPNPESYDPNADPAKMTYEELQDYLKETNAVHQSLNRQTFLKHANYLASLQDEVPKIIAALPKYLKKLQAYYSKSIARQEKLEQALNAYKAEVSERKAAVEKEIRGREPVTYAEMQAMLRKVREGKA